MADPFNMSKSSLKLCICLIGICSLLLFLVGPINLLKDSVSPVNIRQESPPHLLRLPTGNERVAYRSRYFNKSMTEGLYNYSTLDSNNSIIQQYQTRPRIPQRACEHCSTIDELRKRSLIRAVLIYFPLNDSNTFAYRFVQFRWLFRSWIESEMYSPELWRSDLLIVTDIGDAEEKTYLQHFLALGCKINVQRIDRKETSQCLLVSYRPFSKREEIDKLSYIRAFHILPKMHQYGNEIERLFVYYETVTKLDIKLYDFIMKTNVDTFLTIQFGKYVPLNCSFMIGKKHTIDLPYDAASLEAKLGLYSTANTPDYKSTWYARSDQISRLARLPLTILSILVEQLEKEKGNNKTSNSIHYLPNHIPMASAWAFDHMYRVGGYMFVTDNVDVPTDSSRTTYRTYILHLRCGSSTSLFSEKIFRQNSYDGFQTQPLNKYIVREYATLMALESKFKSTDELKQLLINATYRDLNSPLTTTVATLSL
ncbi:unnamed protein product [Didymodactylos carnosus]|uniref:DUF7164 domain-containing protein n=1 Tax=Didymodactylos carnosus TaxID=1234261 RepID=A0A815B0E0_9BILA|nr:unnamed protein product [Didymodactylos carnosus]CAF1264492.1 unnamed protein product [Didymodactylos carnosus]CAF3849625.1 unnamed protein product [Didymodactylos carnosus]CAF4045645.1 unnamed protein product [Didymodactylos carnosus]